MSTLSGPDLIRVPGALRGRAAAAPEPQAGLLLLAAALIECAVRPPPVLAEESTDGGLDSDAVQAIAAWNGTCGGLLRAMARPLETLPDLFVGHAETPNADSLVNAACQLTAQAAVAAAGALAACQRRLEEDAAQLCQCAADLAATRLALVQSRAGRTDERRALARLQKILDGLDVSRKNFLVDKMRLEDKLASANEDAADRKKKLEDLSNTCDELAQQVADLGRELQKAEELKGKLRVECEQVRARVEDVKKTIQDLMSSPAGELVAAIDAFWDAKEGYDASHGAGQGG